MVNSSEMRSFGEELRTFRERKRMSQLKLAQALGVNRQTIVAWELSKNPPKDRTRVLELARILDLNESDTNILLATAFLDPLPLWHVPYHRNPLFTGRAEILQELHRVLIPGSMAAVIQSRAISGLGGIGKTQVALEYAYRYREDYSAVIWLQADLREIFFLACSQLAQDLGLPEQDEADQNRIVAAIKRWLSGKAKWLLILDNVEDFLMIEKFLPPGHRGSVLLTTRAHQVTQHIALTHELEVFPEQDSILLLLRRAGRLALDASLDLVASADYAQAKDLWELVEGLPLALDQIGAYVGATGCSLARYQELYMDQKRRLDLLKRRGQVPPGHPESVAATFSIAFEKIQTINSTAADLLKAFAFLHPKAIPEEIITKEGNHLSTRLASLVGEPLLFDDAVDVLLTYSLIRRDARNNTFSIHRLVQAVLYDLMEPQVAEKWAMHVVLALEALFPQVTEEILKDLEQGERFIQHVLTCVAFIKVKYYDIQMSSLFFKIGLYFRHRGQYIEAEQFYQQALTLREQILGSNHPEVAIALTNLSAVLSRLGKNEQEEQYLQRALRIWEQTPDIENPSYITAVSNLARVYEQQGKYEQAEKLFQQTIASRKKVLGPNHHSVVVSLQGLAHVYYYQGKYEQAELLVQQGIILAEQTLGSSHPRFAYNLQELADIYAIQGKYEQAESLFVRAVDILKQGLAFDHPDVGNVLNSFALLYYRWGKYEQAEQLSIQSLSIMKQRHNDDSPWIAPAINNLALIYRVQGRYEQAEPLYRDALCIWEQTWGSEHPSLAYALGGIAIIYREQGKYEQAEPLFQRALTLRQRERGSQHLETAESLHEMALFYEMYGQPDKALELYQQALIIREKKLGSSHKSTMDTRARYTQLLRAGE